VIGPSKLLWGSFAVIVAMALAFWLTACGSTPPPSPETALSAAMDLIEVLCPPETTVGDCTNRVRLWLPSEPNPYVPPADAGRE